jgi:hypothetical protein
MNLKPKDRRRVAGAAASMLRSSARFSDMGIAATSVVARRVALSLAGDHSEVPMMVPEKIAAFSLASLAMIQRSASMGDTIRRYAMNEAAAGAKTMWSLAACRDPASLMMAQTRVMSEAWSRWMSLSVQLGAGVMTGTDAVMRPVHRAASRNAKRLAV